MGKIGFMGIFAVACVLFGSHAGGGFATGNQATQNYVVHGWVGVFTSVLAMLLLVLTIRECMIMYNTRGLKSYKELFETLYHPLDKLEIVFEIYFYIMVICAVGAVISGAATLFTELGIMPYLVAVVVVGVILLFLTIFGYKLVSQVSTVMSVIILICCAVIFIMGINAKAGEIGAIFSAAELPNGILLPILDAFKYAGFQAVVIPTMIKCGQPLKTQRNATKAMSISFVLNAAALALSCIMLLGWYADFTAAGATEIPTLYICQQLGVDSLYWFYNIALFLCFVSTGVTTVFGVVARFENVRPLMKINKPIVRRVIVSACVMILSMAVSMVGLSNIIQYGYGYCGYVGIVIIIIPFLTVGVYKNRKFIKAHPEFRK
ncbi:MAG TPA: hypothetical protein H9686_06115 [Firmicutes bacterium]|nr:hypothetical protein [Bacillota bacterium]